MPILLLSLLGLLLVLAILDWLAIEVLVKPIKSLARIELHRLRDEYRNAMILSKSNMDVTSFREGDVTISNALFLVERIEWNYILNYQNEVSSSADFYRSLKEKRDTMLSITPSQLKNHISIAGYLVFMLGILDNRVVRVLILLALVAFMAFYVLITPIMFLLDRILKLIKSISFPEAAKLLLLSVSRFSPAAPVIIFSNR